MVGTAEASQEGQMTKIAVSNISISFGGLQALDGVSFGVEEGEIRGIIGPMEIQVS